MGEQRIRGNQSVQVQEVSDSWIQITYGSVSRILPLESPHLSIASDRPSPARLISARAGVFDYVGRAELLADLEAWVDLTAPFAGQVIVGGPGSGKTRLAVELALRLRRRDWLCGFLTRGDGEGRLDALIEAPTARLVVVDYAENRVDQLERLLPQLSAQATEEEPVRVLLLVRSGANRPGSLPRRLGLRIESLERVIEGCQVRVLEDETVAPSERKDLFSRAAAAFLVYTDAATVAPAPDLGQAIFENHLMVVLAAYLAAQGEEAPSNREELLDGVLDHERRYWQQDSAGLGADDVLLERVVAMATLVRADGEDRAAEYLRLLPDLEDAAAERCNSLARWAGGQYPGLHFWNPLEPDLVGEHLVSRCFADRPEVIQGVLGTDDPEEITRPLEVLGRAALDHPRLAEVLGGVLAGELPRLCLTAVQQAMVVQDEDLLFGNAVTAAAALEAALAAVEVDPSVIGVAAELMPPRPDLVLNKLATTLTARQAEHLRSLAESEPDVYGAKLGGVLNNLSNRLADNGRVSEALAASKESIATYRSLAADDPETYAPELAIVLNNLSNRLAEIGDKAEALAASEESVQRRRELAKSDPDTYKPRLAGGLSTLSTRLADNGQDEEALAAIEESVAIYRPLAAEDSRLYARDLAMSLNNLSNRLGDDKQPEALAASEDAVALFRDLASSNPAAHAPDLAMALNNLGNHFGVVGKKKEALAAGEESVRIRRLLAEADPAAHQADLAISLLNMSRHVGEDGRTAEAEALKREALALVGEEPPGS